MVRPGPSLLAVMVRLITHNLLACHAKGCTANNFPLKLSNAKLALREADFNPGFLRGFLPRIEWDALIQASREVTNQSFSFYIEINQVTVLFLNKIGDTSLPPERPEMLDDDLLKQLHHVLLEVSQYAFFSFSLTTSLL
jgi:multifunctional methyltransferase subunit TRM112